MPSKTYVFPIEKPERFLGLSKKESAFRRKEMYFRFRAVFATDMEEAQQFKQIAKLIRIAKEYSSNSVYTQLTESPERIDDLILIIKFEFPDFGKLLRFENSVEQLY